MNRYSGARKLLLVGLLLSMTATLPPTFSSPAGTSFSGAAESPDHRIPPSEYRARRLALMAALPDTIVFIRGTVEEEFGEVGRFFQNPNFMYLTGCETPGAFLILNPFAPEDARDVLYLPARNARQEVWTGPQVGPGPEAAVLFGFPQVRASASFEADLGVALQSSEVRDRLAAKKTVQVYSIVPSGENARFTREHGLVARLREVVVARLGEGTEIGDASYAIGELRRTKSRGETVLLQRAIDITGLAFADAARSLAPGAYEYELEGAIVGAFLRNGAARAGFPSIVGSGINSTTLHYSRNDKRIDADDLVVIDIGAAYRDYTADVTRTLPASGIFTARQREIYQLVLDAQRSAAEAYKPGMSIIDLQRAAVETMRKSPVRDREGNTLERYFLHGLGHFLGMEVHDVGDYRKPLMAGDVFTIEPGIYISAEKLGVRIEDDYLVTEKGLEKLSKSIPSTPDEVERFVRDNRARKER
jgi:Xaa-Pro aminopeptidase